MQYAKPARPLCRHPCWAETRVSNDFCQLRALHIRPVGVHNTLKETEIRHVRCAPACDLYHMPYPRLDVSFAETTRRLCQLSGLYKDCVNYTDCTYLHIQVHAPLHPWYTHYAYIDRKTCVLMHSDMAVHIMIEWYVQYNSRPTRLCQHVDHVYRCWGTSHSSWRRVPHFRHFFFECRLPPAPPTDVAAGTLDQLESQDGTDIPINSPKHEEWR